MRRQLFGNVIGRRQQEALDFISTWNDVWTVDVARRLEISQQAASQLIRKLEQKGLVAEHRQRRHRTLRGVG
jgi:DNA-binding MarR family transcriptional regulator